MYKFKFNLSIFNKCVAMLITLSLLVVMCVFNIEKNIKLEIDTLCKATSISDYYNSVTNFSYNIVNKILFSINVIKSTDPIKKNDTSKEKDTQNHRVDFIQLSTEKTSNSFKFISNINFMNYLITKINNFFNVLSFGKYVLFICISILSLIMNFCYFARGNIEEENIKFNNIVRETRLV